MRESSEASAPESERGKGETGFCHRRQDLRIHWKAPFAAEVQEERESGIFLGKKR